MHATIEASDPFCIAGTAIGSRLLLGTAGYPTQRILVDAAAASGCEIVTASIRRISLQGHGFDTVDVMSKYRFLPNTAGCETARDAIRTAELAREALDTNWVKLEVIGDRETLYPDVTELIDATRRLTDDGFVVLPYCTDDPVRMAAAMRHAVEAGRHAFLAGRIPRRGRAEPSSPQLGLVGS